MMDFRFPDKPVETTEEFFSRMSQAQQAKWIAQGKYDGWRMPTFIDGATAVRCLSSHGLPMSRAYRGALPSDLESHFLALGLPNDTVLDAELVGPRGDHPFSVYVFDMLAYEGKWLNREPFEVRWQRCIDAITPHLGNGMIQLAETLYPSESDQNNIIVARFNEMKRQWVAEGEPKGFLFEGIVAKRRSGKMTLKKSDNQKSPDMFKWKFRDIGDRRY